MGFLVDGFKLKLEPRQAVRFSVTHPSGAGVWIENTLVFPLGSPINEPELVSGFLIGSFMREAEP